MKLHAIEAAISGQGIAICSDVLVAPELASGALVQVSKLTLPGYGLPRAPVWAPEARLDQRILRVGALNAEKYR